MSLIFSNIVFRELKNDFRHAAFVQWIPPSSKILIVRCQSMFGRNSGRRKRLQVAVWILVSFKVRRSLCSLIVVSTGWRYSLEQRTPRRRVERIAGSKGWKGWKDDGIVPSEVCQRFMVVRGKRERERGEKRRERDAEPRELTLRQRMLGVTVNVPPDMMAR